MKDSLKKILRDSSKNSLSKKLTKSKYFFWKRLNATLFSKSSLTSEVYQDIEDILITSDIGVSTTNRILDNLVEKSKKYNFTSIEDLMHGLKEEIVDILESKNDHSLDFNSKKPYVIIVVGINGSGKTSTVGKLAHLFNSQNKKVILGSTDTFRAAAHEQLKAWSIQSKSEIILPHIAKESPSSIAYRTVSHAKESNSDICIIDTAGRLHNNSSLMVELVKLKRVIQKIIPEAPHEILLVIDGTLGQNSLTQARNFNEHMDLSGIIVTKLDGNSKGGIIITISNELSIPIKYISTGEKPDDIHPFMANKYIKDIFAK